MADISRLVLEIDSNGVVKASGNLEEFSKKARQAESDTASLDGVMNQLNLTSIAAGAGILTLYKSFTSLVSSVKNFSQQALQSYSHFEQIESGLQGVLKDVKKGTDMFEDLRKFSFDTTFGVDTLANAAQQLIGVGESASTLKTTLLQLGNVASGDTNKFNELVSIFAKIQNTGKAGSMQLQQLALRGVPIYQYLKQLGVQGTATGEDIRKAFAKMTEEGEVFYGTMNRINDTIQGKEGFISDTWREFLTSFAEASGLADMYKAALDGVYDALQGVVDWLQKINENPVYQAIFRGVLIGLLTTLVVFIGGALIIALKNVIAHLVTIAALQAAINPLKAVAGLAVAAGVTVGSLAILTSGLKEAGNAADETAEKLGKLSNIDLTQLRIDTLNNQITGNTAYIEEAEKKIDSLKKKLEESKRLASKYKSADEWGLMNGHFKLFDLNNEVEKEWEYVKKNGEKKYQAEIDAQNEIIQLAKSRNDELRKSLDLENGILSSQQLYQKAIEKAPEYMMATLTSSEKELAELQKQFDEIQRYASATDKKVVSSHYDPASGKEIKVFVESKLPEDIQDAFKVAGIKLRKQIEDTKIKIAVENQSDWQKLLKSAFSFSDNDVEKYLNTAIDAEDEYIKRHNENMERIAEFAPDISINFKVEDFNLQNVQNEYNKAVEVLNNMLTQRNDRTGMFEWNPEKEEGFKKWLAYVKQLKDEVGKMSYEQLSSQLKEQLGFQKMTTDEIRKQELAHQGIKDKQADEIIALEKQLTLYKDISTTLSTMQTDAFKKGDYGEGIGLMAAQKGIAASGDASNFVSGFAEASSAGPVAGVIGGVVNTVIGAFTNVAQSVDGFGDVLNPITAIAKQFIPIFELIAGIARPIFAILEGFQQLGSAIVEGILRPLQPLLDLISGLFERLANLFTKLFDSLDPIMEVLDMLVTEILSGLDGLLQPLLEGFRIVGYFLQIFTELFKPIHSILMALFSALKLLAAPLRIIGNLLKKFVGKLSNSLGGVTSIFDNFTSRVDKFFGEEEEATDDLISAQKEEAERLRRLNDEYSALYDAMKEQEEYYLTKKNQLNAETYKMNATQVHDMILTDKGVFSTDPKDTILAMKRPGDLLGSGGSRIYVTINNNAGVEVTTEEHTTDSGDSELIVNISRAVAADFASGANGWDSAYAAQQSRMSGRRVSI